MDLITLIQDGSTSFIYLATIGLVLGALHGLEPGHSKTMMAAFIIAVRGTPLQAGLLGVSAAFSHSIIVWIIALLALTYGDKLIGEKLEPYFIAGSGAIVIAVGAFMLFQALRNKRPPPSLASHTHDHDSHHHDHDHDDVSDAHARAHAQDIEKRFSGGKATNLQTVSFGLVGGLIPCPAAITVLLLCLGIDQLWLGVGMVASFSFGLALTLVAVGLTAALSLRYASKKFTSLDGLMRTAPYISSGLIILVGTYMAYSGWAHL
ncbi:MAG: nickel/cobalt efflux transporter [Alphaproteobacteria bacterium]|nr:nickel/cobalt efflux transporter [Rhodospirillales bacterium]MCW9044850.1 nickel/cobalt efflux transporter [Alphaproteobacteria bacterium]